MGIKGADLEDKFLFYCFVAFQTAKVRRIAIKILRMKGLMVLS